MHVSKHTTLGVLVFALGLTAIFGFHLNLISRRKSAEKTPETPIRTEYNFDRFGRTDYPYVKTDFLGNYKTALKFQSATPSDLDGDGDNDIIAVGNDGRIYLLENNIPQNPAYLR